MNSTSLKIPERTEPSKEHGQEASAELQAGPPISQGPDGVHELGLWLLSLESFLDLHNHPFDETEQDGLSRRDLSPETAIAQHTARRCLRLIWQLPVASATDDPDGFQLPFVKNSRFGESGGINFTLDSTPLDELREVLNDAAGLCDAIIAAKRVTLQSWSSLARTLARELRRTPAASQLKAMARTPVPADDHGELFVLARKIAPDALSSDVETVFSTLVLLLQRLQIIDALLQDDQPLKQALPIFTLLNQESRALTHFIEGRMMRADKLPAEIFDVLDRTAYAIGMEVRKVFSHELIGLSSQQQAKVIYSKVENAHGLLRDCLQQSIVALAQVFDEKFDSSRFFKSYRTKLDQSLTLRRDLWTLQQLVMRAAKNSGRQPAGPLLERLVAFQDGSLQYLMYKDWETYERFTAELAAASGGNADLVPLYHRLGTYLETLFGQINMRAVLADHPFDYSPLED
ncbi:MAG: hypothetical protein ACRD9R_16985 [Pyrinomonadaceae bacterium]